MMRWEDRLAQEGYVVEGGQAHRPTPMAPPPPRGSTMPEGVLLAHVRRLAKQYGWLAYHVFDARRSEEGYPDLTMTDGASVLIYELKTQTGKLTVAQAQWLAVLAHTGQVECGVWRPADLPHIEARLAHKARRPTPEQAAVPAPDHDPHPQGGARDG
jgi:hypothetical protein